MSASVTVRPGDSYASPTSMSSKNRRGSAMETEDITPNWRPGRRAGPSVRRQQRGDRARERVDVDGLLEVRGELQRLCRWVVLVEGRDGDGRHAGQRGIRR